MSDGKRHFLTVLKRWSIGFALAVLIGLAVFALPGILPLFGIGITAAANVAAVCAAIGLNSLMALAGGPLHILAAAALLPPAVALVGGIIRTTMAAVSWAGATLRGEHRADIVAAAPAATEGASATLVGGSAAVPEAAAASAEAGTAAEPTAAPANSAGSAAVVV